MGLKVAGWGELVLSEKLLPPVTAATCSGYERLRIQEQNPPESLWPGM